MVLFLSSAPAQKCTSGFGLAEIWDEFQVINLYFLHMERKEKLWQQCKRDLFG